MFNQKMKIFRFLFLAAILTVSYWFLITPQAFAEQTRAEATYAKCQEVEKYYLANVEQPLPYVSDPNEPDQLIVAKGRGFFWNQPNDAIFLPGAEVGAPPVLNFTQEGTYLSPQKVSCELNEGKIRIDMKAFVLVEQRENPFVIDQVDEMWWDKSSQVFKGGVFFSTKEDGTFFQIDGDFVFRGCNGDGVNCSSIDILLTFPVPGGSACADFALENYGLEVANLSEIATCKIYNDNLNYFWDNPKKVVVFEQDDQKIVGSHLQVVNNSWLEVTYQDNSVFEYRGAACFMQYTSNSQQDWSNPDFDKSVCSPKEVLETKEPSPKTYVAN